MNSQSRIEKAFLFSICVGIGLMASESQAQTHSGDIQLLLSNSRLTTVGGTYAGPLNGRVFEGIFPSTGVTSNPGFDSAAGFLQPGETIRFDFVREVLYWNGTVLTESSRSMTVGLGSSLATLTPTDFGGKAGFEIAGGDGIGAFHQHLNFSIGNAAPAGLYGVVMTLGPAGTSTFGTSDPFLIAFRRNALALNPQAGLDAMAATLVAVPEPSTMGLVVAGVVAGIAWRCQRRTGGVQKSNAVARAIGVHEHSGHRFQPTSHLRRISMFVLQNCSRTRAAGRLFSFASMVLAGLCVLSARADEIHVGDIELEIDGDKLVTHNGRYFESAFTTLISGTPSVYRSTSPGFDSAPGLLAYDPEGDNPQQIGFNVLGPLLYWDGAELTAPQVGLGLDLRWAFDMLRVTGANGPVTAGFSLGGATEANGTFHEHFTFEIAASADLGAYGVLLELTPAGSSTFSTSDPFLLVFNRGLGSAEFEAGVDAMVQLTAVPEPSSLALAGLGVAGVLAAGWRRRRRAAGRISTATEIAG